MNLHAAVLHCEPIRILRVVRSLRWLNRKNGRPGSIATRNSINWRHHSCHLAGAIPPKGGFLKTRRKHSSKVQSPRWGGVWQFFPIFYGIAPCPRIYSVASQIFALLGKFSLTLQGKFLSKFLQKVPSSWSTLHRTKWTFVTNHISRFEIWMYADPVLGWPLHQTKVYIY